MLTELNEVLGLEEEFWRHKAKVAWIKGGDRNTKFFYTTTVIQQR